MSPKTSKQQQVFDVLRSRITRGELRPGDEMPPQAAMAEEFGCSNMPVYQAYRMLLDSGLITKSGGGFRVTAFQNTPFLQDATLDGDHLELEDVTAGAPSEMTSRLDVLLPASSEIPDRVVRLLDLGDPPRAVLRREVFRSAGHVSQISELWVSRALAVRSGTLLEPEILPSGALAELADTGSEVTRLRDEISARLAEPGEIELLKMTATQAPVLEALRIGYADDTPVLVHRTVSIGIVRSYDTP